MENSISELVIVLMTFQQHHHTLKVTLQVQEVGVRSFQKCTPQLEMHNKDISQSQSNVHKIQTRKEIKYMEYILSVQDIIHLNKQT